MPAQIQNMTKVDAARLSRKVNFNVLLLCVRRMPNLIYLKGALDYLLWYHLFEAASPGWWQRTNRRLEKEQGRTMVGYNPGRPIPYTPFGIGAR